jgi:hypothetical protein
LSAHLDLRQPKGLETLRGLVREADVFSQGYRPGDRLPDRLSDGVPCDDGAGAARPRRRQLAVRISLAQTGHWLVGRGDVPEAALKNVANEIPAVEIDR